MAEKDSDKQVDEAKQAESDKSDTQSEPTHEPVMSGSGAEQDAPAPVVLLRKIDGYFGVVELAVLCLFLTVMISAGIWETWAFFRKTNEAKPAELIKFSVFFSALTGASLAAQRGQMISMDIVSRLLTPKIRAWVRVVTTLFAAMMCIFLIYKGLQVWRVKLPDIDPQMADALAEPKKYFYFSLADGALAVVVAGFLLTFHFTLHTVVDLVYLVQGKVPPEDAEMRTH